VSRGDGWRSSREPCGPRPAQEYRLKSQRFSLRPTLDLTAGSSPAQLSQREYEARRLHGEFGELSPPIREAADDFQSGGAGPRGKQQDVRDLPAKPVPLLPPSRGDSLRRSGHDCPSPSILIVTALAPHCDRIKRWRSSRSCHGHSASLSWPVAACGASLPLRGARG
jgi:hypothetical protein